MAKKNPGGGSERRAGGVLAQRSSTTTDRLNTKRGLAISAATEKNTRDALHSHVQQLSDFTLESSRYGGHGHAEGKQDSRGHTMPPSDAHMQRDGDRIIPQGAFAQVPQNMESKAGGPFDDYASADEKADD